MNNFFGVNSPVRLPVTRLGVKMRKTVVVMGACALLGGCALPVPIQVASWAVDIISVVATEKSLTDHGISALTNKDCALHRALTEDDNNICRESDGRTDVMTADAGSGASSEGLALDVAKGSVPNFDAVEAQVSHATTEQDAGALAKFETAAGVEQPVVVKVDLAALQPETVAVERPFVHLTEVKAVKAEVRSVKTPAKIAAVPSEQLVGGAQATTGKPRAGFYYVIGSFRSSERAQRHMETYRLLVPAVLQGKIGREGREVFRVVVGPYAADQRKPAYRRIRRAGIPDTWAIRVSPKDWSVAAKVQPLQQADASAVLNARDWPGLTRLTAKD